MSISHHSLTPVASTWSADGDFSKLPELLEGVRSGKLLGLTDLKLSGCGLTELPPEVSQLKLLEKLDLGGNMLNGLPADFSNLVSLRVLFFLNNRFTSVPEVQRDPIEARGRLISPTDCEGSRCRCSRSCRGWRR